MDNLTILIIISNITIITVLIGAFYFLQKKHVSLTKRVFMALVSGIIFGAIIQYFYGPDSIITKETINWFNIIGDGYIRLLKMIVTPLIMVSIISAILKLTDNCDIKKTNGQISKQANCNFGQMSFFVILVLVFTASLASIIGICVSLFFGLTAEGLQFGTNELLRGDKLSASLASLSQISISERMSSLIPENAFADVAGLRSNSTIGVVIFSAFIGIATIGIFKKNPESESVKFFRKLIFSIQDIVLRIVKLIIRLTPYAVLTLMTKILATSNISNIIKLGEFVIASYVALGLAILMHMILLSLYGLNPFIFIKKIFPVLTFAFTSRSSAGTIPLNIKTQTNKLGVSEGIANLAASFGASIGQNGCAAIYPAMLAIMIAPTQGINPTDISFILSLIGIIIITSFGAAGAGGGATISSLMVLSSLNLPVTLVGLLISVEPLIDMGRTAINVSDSMLSGVIASKKLKQFNLDIYNNKNES